MVKPLLIRSTILIFYLLTVLVTTPGTVQAGVSGNSTPTNGLHNKVLKGRFMPVGPVIPAVVSFSLAYFQDYTGFYNANLYVSLLPPPTFSGLDSTFCLILKLIYFFQFFDHVNFH